MTAPNDDHDEELDEAFALYLRACDDDELESRDSFLKQHPEYADQLRELMDAADLIGNYTIGGEGGSPDDSTASDVAASYESDQDGVALPSTDEYPARKVIDLDRDTLGTNELSVDGALGDVSHGDPAATLPMSSRHRDDSGPTLPFDLGEYELLKVLGVGGMGVVYLARQKQLDRLVAVKMIRSGILASDVEVKRFFTEAKAAAKLRHPGIVSVHQFGRRAGHHFFSMQYIEGDDLQRLLETAPLEPRRAARIVRDVAHAISHAHRRGVLHRDLKPANVMIGGNDQVHVTDFGLAKHVDADSSVTGSGAAVGTPHYMAPEQADGHSDHVTDASDIYSLGAILFAAITGRPPIVGNTVMQTLMKVAHQPAPSLRSVQPKVDADLDVVAAKCLEKRPSDRYGSAAALADDLDRYLSGSLITARSRGRVHRTWNWVSQVPLVAALVGRTTANASPTHRRVQTALLAAMVLLPTMLIASWWWRQRSAAAMPPQVTIAGGLTGGLYTASSGHLAGVLQSRVGVPCTTVETGGSWDNRERLLAGDVHLAPMQASAVSGEQLRVVAPLFYEAAHLLVRLDPTTQQPVIESCDQLRDHVVAVGPPGSGSRRVAEMVLDSLSLPPQVCRRIVLPWPSLLERNDPTNDGELDDPDQIDAAIICIGPGSDLVARLLTQSWKLMSLPRGVEICLQHPTLRPMSIQRDGHMTDPLEDGAIQTVGTTAFLVARSDTPDVLVTQTLAALYAKPHLAGLIPASRAAEWQGLAFHRAARQYFGKSIPNPSN
ncbi:MAG: serine/threonine-protein kinase [Planctomycetota bacterium]